MTPPALLLGSAEALLNRLLAQDPHSLQALSQLGGSLLLRHAELGWEMGLFPVAHGVMLGAPDERPTARVELDTRAIFALLRDPSAGRAVPGMQVAGDAEYLQRVADIFHGMQADLAALLEPWLGAQAVPVAQGLLRAREMFRRGLQRFEQSGAEFLTEESRDLVPAAELEAWMTEVDALALGVDRLEARLRRLERGR